LALRWLLTRFEAAVGHVHSALALGLPRPGFIAALLPCAPTTGGAVVRLDVATSALRLRGPPSRLRFTSK